MKELIMIALPEIILFLGLFLGLLVCLLIKNEGKQVYSFWLVVLLFLTSGFLSFLQQGESKDFLFSNLFIINDFSSSMKTIIMFFSILCLFLVFDRLGHEQGIDYEYPFIFGFVVLGLCLSLSSGNLFMLFISLEIVSISLYWLISYKRSEGKALKSTLNFFIISFFGSIFIAFSCALIYGFSGSLSYAALDLILLKEGVNNLGILIGLIFFICGILLKIGSAPFHFWSPEVYQRSSAGVTALLVTVVQLSLLCILFRVLLYPFLSLSLVWSKLIEIVALISLVLGTIGALKEDNIKRFVAYSTLAGTGYALSGIATASPYALKEVLFYLIIYGLMTIGLFAVTSSLRSGGNLCENISKLSGLGQRYPGKALALTLILLSLAGLPPLIGFLGKFGIIMMTLESQKYLLSFFVLLSCIGAIHYYLRIIKTMYFNEAGDNFDTFSISNSIVLKFCAFSAIFLTFYPSILMDICIQASLIIGEQ